MRLIYFADGPWAHNALRKIISEGHEIVLVVLRYETRDPVLKDLAESHGVEVVWDKNVNSENFLSYLIEKKAEIAVSLSFNQIIKKRLINLFDYGFINVHAGKLPEFRGRNILNWALINDVSEIGVTCHYIDEGIDTGGIITQSTFPVSDDDDYNTVLSRAFELCPQVLVEALHEIEAGVVKPVKQPSQGSYCVGRQNGDEFIDWSLGARRIFNHVRAITRPGPGARTWLRSKEGFIEMIIWKTKPRPDYPFCIGVDGSIVGFSEEKNPLARTSGEIIEIISYETTQHENCKLKIGDRLGFGFDLLNLLIRERCSELEEVLKNQ